MSSSNNGSKIRDYAVTIEMAQHLAMMAKTQRAHDYRNYFIECEKQAKSKAEKIDHLSPEVIATLRQARTVQLVSQKIVDMARFKAGFVTVICHKKRIAT